MMKKGPKRQLRVVKTLSPELLLKADLEAAENTLARLVALAYCADHPVMFGTQRGTTAEANVIQLPASDEASPSAGVGAVLVKVLKCAPRRSSK